jgi:hypothetical protein
MTQEKIERYHRPMKNIIKLQNYYFPRELEQKPSWFIYYCNNHQYQESLNNVNPADVYFTQYRETLRKRDQVKKPSLCEENKTSKPESLNWNLKNTYRGTINQMYLLENIYFGTHSFDNIHPKNLEAKKTSHIFQCAMIKSYHD